jgi:ubiquinone/menaquinone biosynthesis C-methylase UbiE
VTGSRETNYDTKESAKPAQEIREKIMGYHTFDADAADRLEDAGRYRFCSREELLGHLDLDWRATVGDIGSGTGFFTDDVAPLVGRIYAVDVQRAMHDYYRSKGVPENVELLTGTADAIPLADDSLDGALSTMTFHEFATGESVAELRRIIRKNGPLVVVDWSAAGSGDHGPPLEERYDMLEAMELLETAGFEISCAHERVDTFLAVVTA